ncbi:hypothetical protein N7513_001799 [Penicillium frequentans]|nr:hypothetical protein N7513_001799 [Penicillium glabrum]
MSKFPEVQGGGSLILAWQIREKHVLVVRGGEVAAGRILHALNADARVTVVCPKQVTHVDRNFEPSDLDDVDIVMCAIDDPEASTQVWKLCKEKRIPSNIADVSPECDFYFGSMHRDGPLQIMVSTNGNGPKLASIVRKKIAATLPSNMRAAITNVGKLRKKLRDVAPKQEEGPKRMKWMSAVCESWSLDDLEGMTEQDMDGLLSQYRPGNVPTLQEVRK